MYVLLVKNGGPDVNPRSNLAEKPSIFGLKKVQKVKNPAFLSVIGYEIPI
jgi:hypothetical protein